MNINTILKKLLLILLFPICIFAQDSLSWTFVDYTLASTLVLGQVADYGLTNHAISNCGANEVNPLFGSQPRMIHIASVKIIITATILLMTKYLITSVSQRRWVLAAFNVITWIPVAININTLQKNGYRVSLKFSF